MNNYDIDMLNQINENVDLIDYVSQSLELEKRGNDYFAHCPKHEDKTPSLSFTPGKNLFYCFGCGRSGGIIKYLMEFEDMTFDEAVKKAAKLSNVDLSQMCQSKTIRFLKTVKHCNTDFKDKKEYQHKILDISEYEKYRKKPITEWIEEGIDPEVMDLFGVRIDIYQNRIIYPVYDINKNLINIKGRTRCKNYKDLKIPKYINYFPVGVMDYFQGLDITLPYVKEKREIIIFESIKSVMKAYGWDDKNCASAEKHTLTNEQLSILIKLKVDVVFAFDSDVSYEDNEVKKSIDKLKRMTNVYLIKDRDNLLGGFEGKNAPVDLGREIWKQLYNNKKKVA